MQKKNNPPAPRHPLRWSLWTLTVCAGLISALVAGGISGALVAYLTTAEPIPELEYYDPPQITRVLDHTNKHVVIERYSEKRVVLSLSNMPANLGKAFVAIEDARFYEHFGIDLRGILRAIISNLQGGRLQGASTITQQMTRNVLSDIGRRRTLQRKIRETLLALRIERQYSKNQILAFYLNQIFLGHGAYGVQAAAQTYFGKNVMDLTLAECAALAAIPKTPSRVNPITNPTALIARRNLVLDAMERLRMVSEEQAAIARHAPLTRPEKDTTERITAPYFVDHVRRRLSEDPDFGEDLFSRGGYVIHSTVDLEWQNIAEEEIRKGLVAAEKLWHQTKPRRRALDLRDLREDLGTTDPRKGQIRLARILAVREDGLDVSVEGYNGFVAFPKKTDAREGESPYRIPYFDPDMILKEGEFIDVRVRSVDTRRKKGDFAWYDNRHIQGAAVLLDARTGRVRALVGGAEFYDMENAGMYNRATMEGRQPGSAFKPLLYATALGHGRTPGSVIIDDRVQYGNYVPRNYENTYHGPRTLWEALAESNNVVTVKLFHELGFRITARGYEAFDILKPRPTWKIVPELPLALGSLNTTPLSIAAAYLPFVRKGLGIEPMAVTRIADLEGRTLRVMKPRERRTMSPEHAYIMTEMLREVVQTGTGRGVRRYFANLEVPVPQLGGKTGTTTNCVDAWFVGFSPDLVLAVWVGFDRVRPMGPGMTGSRVAAPIWRNILHRVLLTRNDWRMTFEVPPDIVFRDIAAQTGLLAAPEQRTLPQVPFVEGTEPRFVSEGYNGFPYWEYQDPDPEKNMIENPDEIPEHLLAPWRERQAELRGEQSPDPDDPFTPPWELE